MRKTLASLVLGAALVVPGSSALAQASRPAEPRWGIRPEKSAPALRDFARWLSERFRLVVESEETEPAPLPAPDPTLVPGPGTTPDVVCPERQHCPIG